MRPAGFGFDKIGIEQHATVIIQGRDERPLLGRQGRPLMQGGIVLDQIANGGGDDFPIMQLFFLPFRKVTPLLDGTLNNCCGRDLHTRFLQSIVERRIVVIRNR